MSTGQQDNANMMTEVDGSNDHVQHVRPSYFGSGFQQVAAPLLQGANRSMNATANSWEVGPLAGAWQLTSLVIMMRDNAIVSDGFMNIASPGLSTGINIGIHNGSDFVLDILDELEVTNLKTNMDLFTLPDVQVFDGFSDASLIVKVTIDFIKQFGQPLRLDFAATEQIRITTGDSMTTLQEMYATAYGFDENART